MNIYLIQIGEGLDGGWDSYDAHVVVAPNTIAARRYLDTDGPKGDESRSDDRHPWLDKRSKCTLIGITNREDDVTHIVLSSYNAG